MTFQSHTWVPHIAGPSTNTMPPVSTIPLDEIENTKNSKNIQDSQLFHPIASVNQRENKTTTNKVTDENKPPEIDASKHVSHFPWKPIVPLPKLVSSRRIPKLLSKFTQEIGEDFFIPAFTAQWRSI